MDRPSADDPGEAAIVAGLLGDGWSARIDRWAADARVDDAARLRARERWLERQAQAEGSLAGVLPSVARRSRCTFGAGAGTGARSAPWAPISWPSGRPTPM